MSQSTPAKQSRHERHLMRQRGAGSRTINTNFDFTFGLATDTPFFVTASELADEPPIKKRRLSQACVVESGSAAPDVTQHAFQPAEHPSTRPVKKYMKARRRSPVEDETPEVIKQSAEDSFVEATRAKKPRVKRKPDAHVEVVLNKLVDAPARSRPRRRAAADAQVKVQEDLAEEAAPVDQRRRDEEPQKGGRRGQKDLETVAAYLVTSHDEKKTQHAQPDENPSKRAPARKLRTTRQKVAPKTTNESAKAVEGHGLPGSADLAPLPVPAPKDRSGKSQAVAAVEHSHETVEPDELLVTEAEQPLSSYSRPPAAKRAAKASNGRKRKAVDAVLNHAESNVTNDKQRQHAGESLPTKPPTLKSTPKRTPLAEADCNVSRLSVSPAKVKQGAKLGEATVTQPTAKRKRAAVDKPSVHANPPKHRKVVAAADEFASVDTAIKQQNRADPQLAEKHDRAPVSAKISIVRESETIDDCPRPSKRSKQLTAHPPNSAKPKKSSKSMQHDDDVGWLFATQSKALTTKISEKASTFKRRMRHSDPADVVDLDDLVANIASLAPQKANA